MADTEQRPVPPLWALLPFYLAPLMILCYTIIFIYNTHTAKKLSRYTVHPFLINHAPNHHLVTDGLKRWADAAGVSFVPVSAHWVSKDGVGSADDYVHVPGHKILFSLSEKGFLSSIQRTDEYLRGLAHASFESDTSIRCHFTVEYRLLNGVPYTEEKPYPAALFDAISGYSYLLNVLHIPWKDVLIGDTSGGVIAKSLSRSAMTMKPGNLPGAMNHGPPVFIKSLCPKCYTTHIPEFYHDAASYEFIPVPCGCTPPGEYSIANGKRKVDRPFQLLMGKYIFRKPQFVNMLGGACGGEEDIRKLPGSWYD